MDPPQEIPGYQQRRRDIEQVMYVATARAIDLNEFGVLQLESREFRGAINSFGNALSLLNHELLSSPFFHDMKRELEQVEGTQELTADTDMASSMERVEVVDHSQDHVYDLGDDMDVSKDRESAILLLEQDIVSAVADKARHGHSRAVVHESTSASPPAQVVDQQGQSQQPTTEELAKQEELIYRNPIHFLPHRLMERSLGSYHNVVEISITIMFNLALSHHLTAVSGQTNDPLKMMGHAVALYELAHSLQIQEGLAMNIEYTMAMICNLGHIHQSLGSQDLATNCFHNLLSILLYLQIQHRSEGETDVATRRILMDSEVFFQSVSSLVLAIPAAAAAA